MSNNNFIPYGRHSISQQDIDEVVSVLKSGFLTQGPKVVEFEQAVSQYTGAKYAVSTNSGTSALHIACLALGLQKGGMLWTTPISFVASANCGLYCGASIDFVDIDPITWNMSVDALQIKLEQATTQDSLPDILVVVHLCGLSCDMEAIHDLSVQYGFKIIEDACHGFGGQYKGSPIGSCQYSDITTFSFHPVKTIAAGEGGMCVTNNHDLFKKMSSIKTHGITKSSDEMTKAPDGPWYYQQIDLGFNYRLTDIHAALGLSQLRRVDEFLSRRSQIADRYDDLLKNLPVQRPHRCPDRVSAMHLYVIRLVDERIDHKQVFETLLENNIGVALHYIPIHIQPYYQDLGFHEDDYPEAMHYYHEAISLPIFFDLNEADQDRVVSVLSACLDSFNLLENSSNV